ncbi:MAG: penicillin acylase family protein [Desulfobacterales bacterium]
MERFFIELVQAGVDKARLDELFPDVLGGLDMDLVRKIKLQDRLVSPAALWNIAPPMMMASNNWVVSGKKTVSRKPVIANDPHLEINRLPNVWYEMALTVGDTYAMGGTMPGAPALLVGRNPHLTWTATYTFMDATDSWIEQCREGKYFRAPDQWVPFSIRKETIRRKKKDPVTVTFYENHHGVLEGDPQEEGYYLATAWAPALSGAETFNNIVQVLDTTSVRQGMDFKPGGNVMEFCAGGHRRKHWLSDDRADAKTAPESAVFVPFPGGRRKMTGRDLKILRICRHLSTRIAGIW